MLIFNKKKKDLVNIYNKIVEESKVSYYLLNSGQMILIIFEKFFN
ncbi:MAG: hypothetical protein CM15mP40_06700 [Alphaproteobacteria bacterium]|nr:MAG: hypothetical protein CM15mP40_06700 [Alphaproteobacteria bacterium]